MTKASVVSNIRADTDCSEYEKVGLIQQLVQWNTLLAKDSGQMITRTVATALADTTHEHMSRIHFTLF